MSSLLLLTNALQPSTEVLPALGLLLHKVRVAPRRGHRAGRRTRVPTSSSSTGARTCRRSAACASCCAPPAPAAAHARRHRGRPRRRHRRLGHRRRRCSTPRARPRSRRGCGSPWAASADRNDDTPMEIRNGDLSVDEATYSAKLRGGSSTSPSRSSSSSSTSPSTRAGSSPARSCSRRSGATTTSAAPARSTSTTTSPRWITWAAGSSARRRWRARSRAGSARRARRGRRCGAPRRPCPSRGRPRRGRPRSPRAGRARRRRWCGSAGQVAGGCEVLAAVDEHEVTVGASSSALPCAGRIFTVCERSASPGAPRRGLQRTREQQQGVMAGPPRGGSRGISRWRRPVAVSRG